MSLSLPRFTSLGLTALLVATSFARAGEPTVLVAPIPGTAPNLPPVTQIQPVDANDLNIMSDVDKSTGQLTLQVGIAARPAGVAQNSVEHSIFKTGGLVTDQIFGEVLGFGRQAGAGKAGIGNSPAGIAAQDLRNWRVVSLRYDSCFPKFDPVSDPEGKECIEQVRLINQPISAGKPTGEDTTMHMLYSVQGFTRSGIISPVKGLKFKTDPRTGQKTWIPTPTFMRLQQLKVLAKSLGIDTNGKPMGPHPAMSNKAFSDAVKQFIFDICSPEKLMVITYMGLQGDKAQPWAFYGGNVTPSMTVAAAPGTRSGREVRFAPGHWVIAPQEGSAFSEFVAFDNLGQGTNSTTGVPGKFKPQLPIKLDGTVNFDALGTLLELGADATKAQVPAGTTLASIADRSVNRTVDPVTTTPDKGDCASCHLTGLRTTNGVHHVNAQGQPSPNAYPQNIADRMRGAPAAQVQNFIKFLNEELEGISAFVEAAHTPNVGAGKLWNARNFGYFNGTATVAEITAISARTVVGHVNRRLLGMPNPGIKCNKGWPSLNECLQFGAGTVQACQAACN